MPGKLYIGTNTKMYKTIAQTRDYLSSLGELTRTYDRSLLTLFVIPSYTALEAADKYAGQAGILLGAQNMCWEPEGPFTGEISPRMLREVGVTVVEIGHSERRHVFGEHDEMINKKVLCALQNGFTALLCIGETMQQKAYGTAVETLRNQLKTGLHGVSRDDLPRLWIAYEPTWAIGEAGEPATQAYAQTMHSAIHQTLATLFGTAAQDIPVLYGGSVNLKNAGAYVSTPGVDGLFIGRSAWDAENFNIIIQNVTPLFLEKKRFSPD